jgi:hypothetical protein
VIFSIQFDPIFGAYGLICSVFDELSKFKFYLAHAFIQSVSSSTGSIRNLILANEFLRDLLRNDIYWAESFDFELISEIRKLATAK